MTEAEEAKITLKTLTRVEEFLQKVRTDITDRKKEGLVVKEVTIHPTMLEMMNACLRIVVLIDNEVPTN